MADAVDAVVIGAGPNGLVAANLLADAGWEVTCVEANAHPGGAVRTAELTVPGFRHDLYSAFYPLAAASPIITGLHLEDHGLRWLRAPLALANPLADGTAAVIAPDTDATADHLEGLHPGDGDGWRRLMRPWDRVGGRFTRALLAPWPPLRQAGALVAGAGVRGSLDLARMAVATARRLGEEHVGGEGARLLLAGNALHADLGPDSAASGLFGWLLCALAQDVGFPVPEGGAGELTAALVRRLEARGGRLLLGSAVERIEVAGGRATGVATADGRHLAARRAVLADVGAPHLYRRLLAPGVVPPSVLRDLDAFQWDQSTVKVDWALSSPIPWTAGEARRAGTVHVADSVDQLSRWATSIACEEVPATPFLLVGQQSMTDPTRQPAGAETAWAYTHVPRRIRSDEGGRITGAWDSSDTDAMVERIEARLESRAPGFRDRVVGRHVWVPPSMHADDANLDRGAINGGTSQLYQQLVFRPLPGLGRPETFVAGLYLASASAHPGGGVHGSCGANAAHAALASLPVRTLWRVAQERVRTGRRIDDGGWGQG